MDNGIYITLSRQLALFRDMDVTANNIANTNTTGYSSEHINFTSYLEKDNNQGDVNNMAFAYDIASYRDTSKGAMKTTNNPFDIAIAGQGYLSVQTPLGVRYTRAGNMQLAGDGTIINAQGYPVLDASGQPIILPNEVGSIEIGSLGNIKIDGNEFNTIGVFRFDNEQLLEPAGDTLFKTDAPAQPIEETDNIKVLHGVLEGSNVSPILEMTKMTKIARSAGTTAKYIEVVYDLQRKASNAWAKQGQ